MGERTPARVFTRAFRTFSPDIPVPDSFLTTVRFDDDSLALVELSYALRRHGDSLRRLLVVGSRGTLQQVGHGESGLHSAVERPPSPAVADAMRLQCQHWAAVLDGRSEPLVTSDQMRRALGTALAAQESLVTGRPVTLPEVDR